MPASNLHEFLNDFDTKSISMSPSSIVYVKVTKFQGQAKMKGMLNVVKYYDEETPILNIHFLTSFHLGHASDMLAQCEREYSANVGCIFMLAKTTDERTILERAGFAKLATLSNLGWKALQKGYTPSDQLQKLWGEHVKPQRAPTSFYKSISPTHNDVAEAIMKSEVAHNHLMKTYSTDLNFELGEFEVALNFVIRKTSFVNPVSFKMTVRSIKDFISLELSDGFILGNVYAVKPPTNTVIKKQIKKTAAFLAFCLLSISRSVIVLNALESKHMFNKNAIDFNVLFSGIQKAQLSLLHEMPLPLHTIWPQVCRVHLPIKAPWTPPPQAMTPENLMPKTLPKYGNPDMSIICGGCEDPGSLSPNHARERDIWVDTECSICDLVVNAKTADGTVIGTLSFNEESHITVICMWTLKRSSVTATTISRELLLALEDHAREIHATYIRILPLLPKRKVLEGVFAYADYHEVGGDAMFKTITKEPTFTAVKNMAYSPTSTLALSSIRSWTTDAYFLFNRALRQGTLTHRHLEIYKGILAYFKKYAIEMPIDASDLQNLHNMTQTMLYRGVHPLDRNIKNADVMNELFPNGNKLEDKGFMAFSKIESVSEEFACKARGKGLLLVFDINDFPDKSLIDIEPVSTLSEERELLALPGYVELVQSMGSKKVENKEFPIWKAKYMPMTPMTEDDALQMAESNKVPPIVYSGPPLVPGQSALKPELVAKKSGGGSVESYIARLFAEKMPDAKKLDITNKLAIFYNYNPATHKFQILRVLVVKPSVFLPDEIAELDAKQARLPEIKAVWQALKDAKDLRNKKLASRLTAQAMLTNVSIAIADGAAGIQDWRYGDIYELPPRYHPALLHAIRDAAAASY